MALEKRTYENNVMAEEFQAKLTLCHNILRSQEGMMPESAFRELNKLLFVKFFRERMGEQEKGFQHDDYINHLFERVKDMLRNEPIFDYSEQITAHSSVCYDVLGTLDCFNFGVDVRECGLAYENFVKKVLRNFSDEPILPEIVAEYIIDYLNVKQDSNVIDPFCGYGGLLTVLTSQERYKRKGQILGYEKDMMLAQTAKMNLLLHGDLDARIEREDADTYRFNGQYGFVITCIKHRDRISEDITKAIELAGYTGKVALLVPEEVLQKEQYWSLRRNLIDSHTVMAIVSLPVNAIRTRGRQGKWSILFIAPRIKQNLHDKTMIARVENLGVTSLGLPSEKNDFKELGPAVHQWMQYNAMECGKLVMWMNLYDAESWNVEAEFLKRENRNLTSYPLRRLWELAEMRAGGYELLSRDEYRLVTVRQNKHDVVLRETIKTKDIKHPRRQTVVHGGQMLISRIGAKDGAIGIVPKELDEAIVSDNYMVLDIREEHIEPFYLLMVLTSERYKMMLKGISRGVTSRSYIKNQDLMELEIPVPDINMQKELVKDLKGVQEQINQLENRWEKGVESFSNILFGL